MRELDAQVGGAQAVSELGSMQVRLTPLQTSPQIPSPEQGGRPPTGCPVTTAQRPPFAHDSHCWSQARSQQTPSLTMPLAHSDGNAAVSPSAFKQVPSAQMPLRQRFPQLPQFLESDW
jgi:hypothetical protein